MLSISFVILRFLRRIGLGVDDRSLIGLSRKLTSPEILVGVTGAIPEILRFGAVTGRGMAKWNVDFSTSSSTSSSTFSTSSSSLLPPLYFQIFPPYFAPGLSPSLLKSVFPTLHCSNFLHPARLFLRHRSFSYRLLR